MVFRFRVFVVLLAVIETDTITASARPEVFLNGIANVIHHGVYRSRLVIDVNGRINRNDKMV
jgi:hypothetical protein